MPSLNLPPRNLYATVNSIVRPLIIDRLYPQGKPIDVARLSEIFGVAPAVIYRDFARLRRARELADGIKVEIKSITIPRRRYRTQKRLARKQREE